MNAGLGSLEDIAELYEKELKPHLLTDEREAVLTKYKEIFDSVDPADPSTHSLHENKNDLEHILKKIVLTTISETSKDFTLIFNV